MPNCFVLSCKNKGNIPGVSYHQLGKRRYDSWLKAIGRNPNEKVSALNTVCSIHFYEVDLIKKGASVTLRKGAIPKLFLPRRTVFQTAPNEIGDTVDSCLPSPSNTIEVEVEVSPKMTRSSPPDRADLKEVQKKNRKLIKTMHNYASTPDSYKTKFLNERNKVRILQYRRHLEREEIKRLRRKVFHLRRVVTEISKRKT